MSGVNLGSAYGEIVIGTQQGERNIASLSSTLRSVGTTMSLAISAPLLGVGAAAIASASGFEQSMNVMQQVSGATGAQMEALQAQALQLGADTTFSAGEAAEAMLELAKAGMSVDETGAAIGGVMDLAAAGGLGLADAATITANAINSFGLEAGSATQVANTFAAAANASSADVSDLAQGFQMAGAVFASNGQSVEDLAASLAILSNNGIAGSDAGTSLKTMMMRLAAPTDEAAGAMNTLGLNVYDATGAMLPFGEIVANLETATAGMSDAQRNAALSTIFGADAIRAATILAGEGGAAYDEMKDAVQEEGAAAEVAGARMGGFRGAMEQLKGAADSFLIGTALPLLDSLSGLVLKAGEAVNWFGGLSEPVKNAALAFGAVLAAAGPLMLAISGIGAVLGALLSPVGLVAVAVATLAAAWAGNWGGIREKTAAAWAVIQPLLGQALTWFQATIPAALTTLQTGFSTAWTAVSSAVSTAWTAIQPLLGQLQAGFVVAWAAISSSVQTAVGVISERWTAVVGAFQGGLTSFQSIVGELGAALLGINTETYDTTDAIREFAIALTGSTTAADIVDASLKTVKGGLTTLQTAAQTAWGAIQAGWNALTALLEPAIARVQTAFGGLGTSLGGLGPSFAGLGEAFAALWTAVQPILTALGTALAAVFGVVSVALVNGFAAAIAAIGPVVQTAVTTITNVINGIAQILTDATALVMAVINGDWAGAWTAAGSLVSGFETLVTDIWNGMSSLVGTIFTAIKTTVVTTLTDLGVDVSSVLTGIQTTWNNIFSTLAGYVQPAIDAVGNVVNALQGAWDWLTSHVFTNPFSGWDFNPFNNGEEKPPVPPGQAVGTNWSPAGLVEVGERGREFIVQAPGARTLTNGQSNRLEAAWAAPAQNYTFGPIYIQNEMDMQAMYWKFQEMTRRRGG